MARVSASDRHSRFENDDTEIIMKMYTKSLLPLQDRKADEKSSARQAGIQDIYVESLLPLQVKKIQK